MTKSSPSIEYTIEDATSQEEGVTVVKVRGCPPPMPKKKRFGRKTTSKKKSNAVAACTNDVAVEAVEVEDGIGCPSSDEAPSDEDGNFSSPDDLQIIRSCSSSLADDISSSSSEINDEVAFEGGEKQGKDAASPSSPRIAISLSSAAPSRGGPTPRTRSFLGANKKSNDAVGNSGAAEADFFSNGTNIHNNNSSSKSSPSSYYTKPPSKGSHLLFGPQRLRELRHTPVRCVDVLFLSIELVSPVALQYHHNPNLYTKTVHNDTANDLHPPGPLPLRLGHAIIHNAAIVTGDYTRTAIEEELLARGVLV